eukprot:TRINITY_DN25791_c0_g1_i1.p1 TRINITY_DN25791_c0_g1~~TRINITY_DN25791_c0_g1_i1.p1  ORF type:complete len:342 (+),score=60.45 TRINITY_DN25791_c0_g1_i1:78-1103(+)
MESTSPTRVDLTVDEEAACDGMMAALTQQVLEERLAEVVTLSPGPASPKARPVLESSTTLDVLRGAVMETYDPAVSSGRFTSRLRPKGGYTSDQGAPRPAPRPGRLGGAVEGAGSDPIFERSIVGGAESKQQRPSSPESAGCRFQELPAFRHLALLEEAVGFGKELPLLPQELPAPAAPGRLAPMTGSARAAAATLSLQGLQRGGSASTPRSQLLKEEEATASDSSSPWGASPRLLVQSGGWGLQAPQQAVGMLRRPAGNAAPLGFNKSLLRGTGVTRKGCGAAATAMWITTETQRLRKEYSQKTSLGSSYAAAFLVNDGPERMMGGTPLSARLTREQPAL